VKQKTLSAGVVVVREEEGVWQYLALRAYDYWDFPKGMVEQGEDPLDAAVREVEEEAGITDLVFFWGDDFRETPPYGAGKVARYYVAKTRRIKIVLPISPELGRPEHHEYRWVSYEAARALMAPRLVPILEWADQLITCAAPPSSAG
jgi:8-oxo-dGTP pyrophosphatase MutT (NUDIX family)